MMAGARPALAGTGYTWAGGEPNNGNGWYDTWTNADNIWINNWGLPCGILPNGTLSDPTPGNGDGAFIPAPFSADLPNGTINLGALALGGTLTVEGAAGIGMTGPLVQNTGGQLIGLNSNGVRQLTFYNGSSATGGTLNINTYLPWNNSTTISDLTFQGNWLSDNATTLQIGGGGITNNGAITTPGAYAPSTTSPWAAAERLTSMASTRRWTAPAATRSPMAPAIRLPAPGPFRPPWSTTAR